MMYVDSNIPKIKKKLMNFVYEAVYCIFKKCINTIKHVLDVSVFVNSDV